jgi:hypothetical protein
MRQPDSYHWALFLAPKDASQKNADSVRYTKYHIKNTIDNTHSGPSPPWRYERVDVDDISDEPFLLVQIVVGKVLDVALLERVLEYTPIYQEDDPDEDMANRFSCRTWLADALERLRKEQVVSCVPEWSAVEAAGVNYVQKKKNEGWWDLKMPQAIPVYDMLTEEELF